MSFGSSTQEQTFWSQMKTLFILFLSLADYLWGFCCIYLFVVVVVVDVVVGVVAFFAL